MYCDMFDEPDDYINSCVDVNAPIVYKDIYTEMFKESDNYVDSCIDVNAPYFKTDYHIEIFKEPDDYIDSCVDIPNVSIKLSKEKKFLNKLYQDHNSPYLLKMRTIKGTKAYRYLYQDYYNNGEFKCEANLVLSKILDKQDNILYASGYKDEPMIITDDYNNILHIIDNNNILFMKNKNIDIKIDLYHSKIVYIDTITVKQKVALMLSLMNYEDLPYEPYIFKKICNYIT